MKPLFCPLKKQYFNQFKDGTKSTEYRGYGRQWTERTVIIGRPITLSCGYNGERIHGIISSLDIISIGESPVVAQELYSGRYDKICAISITIQPT